MCVLGVYKVSFTDITGPIIRLPCLQKHDVSYTYLVEDRAEFHANEGNVQIILPYPTDFLHD